MRAIVLLAPFLLLAGCAQVDDAKGQLDQARTQLDDAKREAQEAKDRYERVKSATIVRTERVDLLVQAAIDGTNVTFNVTAVRGSYTIPKENLTSVQPIAVASAEGMETTCDPLTCVVRSPQAGALTWGWADETARVPITQALSKSRGTAGVTTAAGDVTG